jgi:ubiquinone/menaquinone biosynthesis C-methylase UbiE
MSIINKSFDTFANEYDFSASFDTDKYDFFISNMSDVKGSALDIGCGSGRLAFELAKHYKTVVGIDNSNEMLAIAQEKRSASNIEYLLMDANRISLDQEFDFIASASTFHHLDDLPLTLESIKHLLNPDGKIVISDLVSKVETPSTISYLIGALRDFVPDTFGHGYNTALRLFRFHTSRPWLRHLASDRFLSEQRFGDIYGYHFHGCLLARQGISMTMVWKNIG